MSEPRKYRMTPSDRAGYGPGLWVVQYYDRDMRVWFDVGDPLDRGAAQERLEFYRAGGHETTTTVEDD